MFHNNKPVFAGGAVLKAKMLDNVSQYPREMFDIIYAEHSSGIITGAAVSVRNGTTICISKGIIKFKGSLYHMSEEYCVEAQPGTELQYLRLRFREKEEYPDEEKWETELVLDTAAINEDCELELCRFVLNPGAVLRTEYTDLRDYATVHNTINTLETKYSAIHESTFNPMFLLDFGRRMTNLKLTNVDDVVFVSECMKEAPIKRELIENYISKRLNEPKKHHTNQEMYRKLIEVTEIAKRGEGGAGMQGRMPARRMLVD